MGKKGKSTERSIEISNEDQLKNDIYRDLIFKIVIPLFTLSIAGIIGTFFHFQGRIGKLEGALMTCRCIPGGKTVQGEDFPADMDINLENIRAGQQIGQHFELHGKASGDLKGHHLWVVVHPVNSNGWWPQTGEFHPDSSTGNWRVPLNLGGKDDGRREFEVIVVLANKKAHASFNLYLQKGDRTHDYPAKPLPEGVRILKKISVIR